MGEQLILREWLDALRIPVRKLAEQMPDSSPSYRTLDEMTRRGTSTLATASAVVKGLNKLAPNIDIKIDDIIISDDIDPKEYIYSIISDQAISKNAMNSLPSNDYQELDQVSDILQSMAENNNGQAGELARQVIQEIDNNRFFVSRKMSDSDFRDVCYNIIKARSSNVNALSDEQIYTLIFLCGQKKADDVVDTFVNIYTNVNFDINPKKLALFAKAMQNEGYEAQSVKLLLYIKTRIPKK